MNSTPPIMHPSTPVMLYTITPENLALVIAEIRKQEQQKGNREEHPMIREQACAFLHCHDNTLSLRMKGGLPFHKLGGTCYFYASELNAHIKSKK